jgi:hypothetical protein
MSCLDHRSMQGLTAEQQAKQAIEHLLKRVRDDDRMYFMIGLGSESFALLTEAYATLTGSDVVAIRKLLAGITPDSKPFARVSQAEPAVAAASRTPEAATGVPSW